MSGLDDYISGMSVPELTDQDIEQLLTGSITSSDELADLERFVSALSADSKAPRDTSFTATSLAAVARQSRRSGRGTVRRLAVLMASMALLFAFSGIALATVANGASPGGVLYGVDRALERLGIGDGGVDERITEFDSLISQGADDDAFIFLADYVESSEEGDASIAVEHLVMTATDENTGATAAQKVSELLAFIEDNGGDGIGLDGGAFGRGVAQIAQSKPSVDGPASQPPAGKDPQPAGPPTTDPRPAGPPTTTNPPRDTTPSAPDNQGQGRPEDPGPPDGAGQSPGTRPGADPAGSEKGSGGNPGRGAPLQEGDDGGQQGKSNGGGRQGGD